MLRKLLLFSLLMGIFIPTSVSAWDQKPNAKVTEDISGYYVIRGYMDDEYFTGVTVDGFRDFFRKNVLKKIRQGKE